MKLPEKFKFSSGLSLSSVSYLVLLTYIFSCCLHSYPIYLFDIILEIGLFFLLYSCVSHSTWLDGGVIIIKRSKTCQNKLQFSIHFLSPHLPQETNVCQSKRYKNVMKEYSTEVSVIVTKRERESVGVSMYLQGSKSFRPKMRGEWVTKWGERKKCRHYCRHKSR